MHTLKELRTQLKGFGLLCLSAVLLVPLVSQPVAAQSTIGSSMVTYLESKLGTRQGGGECSHMATEALRISGGEFVPSDLGADFPSSGNLVWGTLVTVISYSSGSVKDSNPTAAIQPGDIIQYCSSAKIAGTSYPKNHTSVVRTVNTATASRPLTVFQQNFGGFRVVKTANLDVTKLTAGSLRIYRPIARKDAPNTFKFTVVNNTVNSQSYSIWVDTTAVFSSSLSADNSASSFRIHKVSTSGIIPAVVFGTPYSYVELGKGFKAFGAPIQVGIVQ